MKKGEEESEGKIIQKRIKKIMGEDSTRKKKSFKH